MFRARLARTTEQNRPRRRAAERRRGRKGSAPERSESLARERLQVRKVSAKAAVGERTGKLRWSYTTGRFVYASPGVWRDLVLVGSYDHVFYAFDAATGEVRWRFSANGPISGSASIVGGVVYFSTFARRTYGLDARTGRPLWQYPDGEYTPVVADPGRLYVVGYRRVFAFARRPRR